MPKKINYADLYTLRKDGRYMGYYRDADGKRRAVYDRDPEQLHRRLEEIEARQAQDLTFRDLAEAWEDRTWDSYKDGTRSSYASALRRALDELGSRPASEVGTPEIFAHLERLRSLGFSAKTIKTQRTVYSQIFRMAVSDRVFGRTVTQNPAAGCPLPAGLPRPVKREAPDDEAVAKIRSAAATAYNGLLPLFLMATGLRRGEALGIQWGDVDFSRMEISCRKAVTQRGGAGRITDTKTANAIRTVPILPDLEQVLRRPNDAKDSDFVFCGEDPSRPLSKATYERRWLHYCKELGFVEDQPETRTSTQGKVYTVHHYKPTLTAHMLRHGYATLLFEAGVDVYTAKKLLGHADITTTMAIYTHLRQRKNQESVDKLRAYVANDLAAAPVDNTFDNK